jgi:hypothetical protein
MEHFLNGFPLIPFVDSSEKKNRNETFLWVFEVKNKVKSTLFELALYILWESIQL